VRRPLILLTLGAALAAPLAAGAEALPYRTAMPAPRATLPAVSIQKQPMMMARPIKTQLPGDLAEIRVKDSWTNDDGFRFAKGKLNFRHRF
jgi:hypothetical protein